MSLINVRRCYMEDYEWERTSSSYKDLIPLRNFDSSDEYDETPFEHYKRLKTRFNIPPEVVEQWIYPHYYNVNFINNYGWLDFDKVAFELCDVSTNELINVKIFSRFERFVESLESRQVFEEFTCTEQDKKYWIENKTWKVPPIIIDISTLNNIPDHSELKGTYQLVEGHTRLGYLLAIHRKGLIDKEKKHMVYKMYSEN
jgi:hypothetical protein